MLHTEIIDDPDELERYVEEWDDLASQLSEPYCTPTWMLAWWSHLAPRGARLRVLVATLDDRVVGIAPLFVETRALGFDRYRVLGAGTSGRVNLLAQPGFEASVATVFSTAFAKCRPYPQAILFEGIPSDSQWPDLLREHWPGATKPTLRTEFSLPEPIVTHEGATFETWFDGKSANFRQQLRRRLRQLESAGASFQVLADDRSTERSLQEFAELHRRRWSSRGGSTVMKPGVEEMLNTVARSLGTHDGRFRLWMLRSKDDQPIAALLFLNVGDETSWWLGGFDEDWARYQPALATMLVAIKDAFSRNDRRVNLGPGGQPMKYRFADTELHLNWVTLVPRRRDLPLARIQLAPLRGRMWLAEVLPDRLKRRVRRLRSPLGHEHARL